MLTGTHKTHDKQEPQTSTQQRPRDSTTFTASIRRDHTHHLLTTASPRNSFQPPSPSNTKKPPATPPPPTLPLQPSQQRVVGRDRTANTDASAHEPPAKQPPTFTRRRPPSILVEQRRNARPTQSPSDRPPTPPPPLSCPVARHGEEAYVLAPAPNCPVPPIRRRRTHPARRTSSTPPHTSNARIQLQEKKNRKIYGIERERERGNAADARFPTTEKSRTIAVRLISMAMTGYYKTFVRPRTHRPLSMLKYDPVGTSRPSLPPPIQVSSREQWRQLCEENEETRRICREGKKQRNRECVVRGCERLPWKNGHWSTDIQTCGS